MKQFLKNSSAFLLAILVLFSTFSFTINAHYCGGEMVSQTIGFAAENCNMEVETTDVNVVTMQAVSCCDDVTTFIQGQDELSKHHEAVIASPQFIKAFVYSYIFILPKTDTEKTAYKPYVPPPLIQDIQLLDETFLI